MKKEDSHSQKEILLSWIKRSLEELKTGEEFYLPCHSKDQQKVLFKAFKKELSTLEKIDPMAGASLDVYYTFRDKRFWVVLRKIVPEMSIGFKKDLSGVTSKVTIEGNNAMKRRISLMRQDGMTWEDIEEIEGEIPDNLKEELR